MSVRRMMLAMLVVAAGAFALRSTGTLFAADGMADSAGAEAGIAAPDDNAAYRVPPNYAKTPAPEQPIPFSHAFHAGQLAMPCATCHTGGAEPASSDAPAANGAHMTFPASDTCMRCHQAVAKDKPPIRRLTEYHDSGTPVPWQRVYKVLDGVAWSHAPHIAAGVACQACHGEVQSQQTLSMVTAVTAMATCLGCHRANGAPDTCDTCHYWPREEHFNQWRAQPESQESAP